MPPIDLIDTPEEQVRYEIRGIDYNNREKGNLPLFWNTTGGLAFIWNPNVWRQPSKVFETTFRIPIGGIGQRMFIEGIST